MGHGESYRASLVIAERLAAADPSNAQLQRDLSASQEKIGNVLADQGDTEAALAAYQTSLTIAERLAAADRSNATIQRDLSLSHANVGRMLIKQKKVEPRSTPSAPRSRSPTNSPPSISVTHCSNAISRWR